jgi:hypothetical protein
LCPFTGGKRGKRNSVAKVVERVDARYEVQDVEFGKVYKWRPESVVLECECGEEPSLTASKSACPECGADYRDILEGVLDAHPEDKVDRPWRSPRPYYTPTSGA